LIDMIMIDKLKEQYTEELTEEFFSGFRKETEMFRSMNEQATQLILEVIDR